MIQIYSPVNTDFEMNGDMTLFPTVCKLSAELGGAWYLDITHPIDEDGRWKYIEREAVLSVPTFMSKNQLFRIDKILDKTDEEISAKAYPIFFDAADDCFLMDKRPTGKTGQEALDIMTEGSVYSGESDIDTVNTAYFVRRNLMDCISGDSPSFLEMWGGEPLYDNYKVIINKKAGVNSGAEVRYGKNMVGVNVSEDMSTVVTRIVPTAFNGRTLSTNYVDSPNIDKYAKIYTKEIKFLDVKLREDVEETEDVSQIIVCENQTELDSILIEKANEQFEQGIDLYNISIEIDMVALENTEEYKDFQSVTKIGLGDTILCNNTKIGIQTKARVIEIEWNCITDSVDYLRLGDYKYNFLDVWRTTTDKIENNLTEREEELKKLANRLATSSGLFKTEERQENGSTIYYFHNKELLADSEIVWKMTAEAFAISTDGGKTYPYGFDISGTAILEKIYTIGLNADHITTGTLVAKDSSGNVVFSVNTETGQIVMSASSIAMSGGKSVETAINDANDKITASVLLSQGKMMFTDPMFETGHNSTATYNNANNGNVTKTRTARSEDNPTKSEYELMISNKGSASPSLGGFTWNHTSRANAIFVYRIIAKIPTGYNIQFASNATGESSVQKWLTDTKGTGKFTEYIFKLKCGATGSFSSTGYFYIKDGAYGTEANPVVWNVAYATCFDMTDKPNPVVNMSQSDVFNKLTNNGELEGLFMEGGKMYINGTYIRVDDLAALNATIGNWHIGENSIYSDIETTSGTYRVYIQSYSASSGTDTWIYSVQRLVSGNSYEAIMYIRGDGKMYVPGFVSPVEFAESVKILKDLNISGNITSDINVIPGKQITVGDDVNHVQTNYLGTTVTNNTDGTQTVQQGAGFWVFQKDASGNWIQVAYLGKNLDIEGWANIAGALTVSGDLKTNNGIDSEKAIIAKGSIQTKTGVEVFGATPYVDFHYGNSTSDFTGRIIETASGVLKAYNSIANASDERLKKDFSQLSETEIERYIQLYDRLEPTLYRYIKGDDYLNVGLIAQEVMAVEQELGFEESVLVRGTGKEITIGDKTEIDYYAIDYNAITMLSMIKNRQTDKRLGAIEKLLAEKGQL